MIMWGRSRSPRRFTASASATSISARPCPTTSCPALPAASTMSLPSCPLAPATKTFIPPPSLNFDDRVVADQETQGLRQAVAAGQFHVATEEAGLHPGAEVLDGGVGEDDRVLDLAAADRDLGADRGVGADEGVFDAGAGTDHGGGAGDRA